MQRMQRQLGIAIVLLGACGVGVASAQDATVAQDAAAAVPPAEAASDDLAAELYELAFDALAQGQREHAIELLTEIDTHHAEHRLAARARELLAILAADLEAAVAPPVVHAQATQVQPEQAGAPRTQPKTTGTARAELVFFQTLNGLSLGLELCAAADCRDARPWALAALGGAGAGLGISLYASRHGIAPGLARALTTGTEWGAFNGLMVGASTNSSYYGSDEDEHLALSLLLGQILGMGAGGALYSVLTPSTGQVSLTSSGGLWATAAAGLVLLMVADDVDDSAVFWTLMAAGDLGLIAGAALASVAPMSASRVLLIDAGGLVGTLGGVGMSVLLQGDDATPGGVGALGLVGLAAGLSLTWYATRDWDKNADQDATDLALGLKPAQGGVLATARMQF